jgi:butyrate kinase
MMSLSDAVTPGEQATRDGVIRASMIPPELPDLENLEAQARRAVDFWTKRVKEAQAQLDNADAILSRLTGVAPARRGSKTRAGTNYQVKDEMLRRVLTALANGSPRKPTGIAGDAGCSVSHANGALRELARRGFTVREAHHHGYRHQITDAGMEWLTNPEGAS